MRAVRLASFAGRGRGGGRGGKSACLGTGGRSGAGGSGGRRRRGCSSSPPASSAPVARADADDAATAWSDIELSREGAGIALSFSPAVPGATAKGERWEEEEEQTGKRMPSCRRRRPSSTPGSDRLFPFFLPLWGEKRAKFFTKLDPPFPPRDPLPARPSHSSRWLSLWPTAPWASRRRYGRALKRNRGLLLSPLWNEDIAVLLWSSSLSVLVLGSSREERTRGHHDHHPLRHGHLCCFSPVFLASETLRGLVQTHRISRGTPQRQAEAGGTAELVKRIVLSRKAHPCLDRRRMSLSSSFCSLSGLHPPPSARKLPPFSSLAPSLRTESAKR